MGSIRLPRGGDVDRDTEVTFRFDGRALVGLAGDTLASALLANDVDVVCRSPLLGRPRGVMTAGPEEPCAMVEVDGPAPEVIAPATVVELVDGLVARGRPGTGRVPWSPPPRCEHRYAHVETLVVGAGPAGRAAALEAAEAGDRVFLVDGRAVRRASAAVGPAGDARDAAMRPLVGGPDVTVLARSTALGVYDDGFVAVHERAGSVERLWHVRARRVVVATGAYERPIAFRDNDRPGVMLAGAVRRYVDRFAVAPGERPVIFTNNDSAYDVVRLLLDVGIDVVAVVDVRPEAPDRDAARGLGVEVIGGGSVVGIQAEPRVSSVRIEDASGTRVLAADLLAVSGGWNPATQLARMIGVGLRYDDGRACFVPDGRGPDWLRVVGAAAGDVPAAAPYWYVPDGDLSRHFVDHQRDATIDDVRAALANGFRSTEHVKRATTIGTAVDQGRLSGVVTAEVVNALLGSDPGAQGPTSARPPSVPVSYSLLAGRARGTLFDPVRGTPIDRWHVQHGAVFENVGQWRRPWYFPRPGEEMEAAVARECAAVRNVVAAMDASTLGKIDVRGPDAPAFLDRMYTNVMSTVPVGSIRYGLMLGVDGMVMDDGVAMRLAPDRYLVTTTTGGAAKVLDHFEEWLQTEWPDLRAYCTSVTEQWATAAVAGPRAREVIAAAGTDVDLSADAFPFMTLRRGMVAGIPTRLARVSFSGELAYELHTSSWHGASLWEAVMAAGAPAGITPYGTEAMHVLRAEKGFIIVGQDTDGTVTPDDLGMRWIVNHSKGDFVGARSLRRPDTARTDRKQLVGLVPNDRSTVLPEGAQLTLTKPGDGAAHMVGHVTSSYPSGAVGRSFALALLERGRDRRGETVFAPLGDRTIAADVVAPIFYDREGSRRDG